MTSSPTEMRTTAVTKPAVKTSCHGCSCREDALVNPCQNSRKPRQTTTPTQSGYLRSQQKSQQRLRPRELESQTKADDDADTERLPPEPSKVPTAATPTRATNLRSRLRAWVDDAETERLPPRHRIRPRERFPATENCPREHISDENFSTSSPLLRRGLRKGGHNQY